MTTYYFHPLPQIPDVLLTYCNQQDYLRPVKRKYIFSQVITMKQATDIDELLLSLRLFCSSISKSSVYQVLQWMIDQDLVIKTCSDDNLKVLYIVNITKLNALNTIDKAGSTIINYRQPAVTA